MGASKRQYLFGLIFIGVGIYQLVMSDYTQFALYVAAGLAFIVNTLVSEPRLAAIKKPLVIATWILIISSAVLFLYVLQFQF